MTEMTLSFFQAMRRGSDFLDVINDRMMPRISIGKTVRTAVCKGIWCESKTKLPLTRFAHTGFNANRTAVAVVTHRMEGAPLPIFPNPLTNRRRRILSAEKGTELDSAATGPGYAPVRYAHLRCARPHRQIEDISTLVLQVESPQ